MCGKPLSKTQNYYCCRLCTNRGIAADNKKWKRFCGSKHPYWKGGTSSNYYRKLFHDFLPKKCEKCSSERYLVVHHIDEDSTNNKIENLMVVCRSCHQKIHKSFLNFKIIKSISPSSCQQLQAVET